jgi:hypothetical protein
MTNPKEIVTLLAVIIISLGVMLMINSAQRIAEPVIDCSEKVDSLENEIFIQKNLVGKYELTIYELIQEKKLDSVDFENTFKNKE